MGNRAAHYWFQRFRGDPGVASVSWRDVAGGDICLEVTLHNGITHRIDTSDRARHLLARLQAMQKIGE